MGYKMKLCLQRERGTEGGRERKREIKMILDTSLTQAKGREEPPD